MKRICMGVYAAVLVLAGCGGREPLQPDRPDIPRPGTVTPENPDTPGEDIPPSPEDIDDAVLGDAAVRYVSSALTLEYQTGGVIYSYDSDVCCYSLVDITTGASVEFRSALADGPGPLADAVLTVNGVAMELVETELVKTDGAGTRWIKMTEPRGRILWLVLQEI